MTTIRMAGRNPLLPARLNEAYTGSRYSMGFLMLVAVGTLLPGCIHAFLPDGGAGVIAGLDLGQSGDVIVSVFAWAGATQIVWGIMLMTIALKVRVLIPLALLLVLIERTIIGINAWVLKAGATGHHPPEAYVTLVVIPLLALALYGALRSGTMQQQR